MNCLLIVESPSKCSKIESYIKCKCISSKGHIRELKKLPVINEEPLFELVQEKKTHIESMKKVIKKYLPENIYLATDDDREGEAIAWHICEVFGLSVEKTKRIIFHEVTKTALEKAIENPTLINMNLVCAQKTRQILDMMVGFKISPVLWKYLYRSKNNCLSAGRCQTPALRLVYDNEQEKKEISQTYKIVGYFYPKKIEFILSKELENKEEVLKFLEESKNFLHKFSVGVKKEILEASPKPYHTSGLLQSASSVLKMSPKEVMSGCQQLYQEGHITYMRTESRLYCSDFLNEVRQFIADNWNETYIGNLEKLENKESGNPHEAIRVTHLELRTVEGVSARIGKLYEFIWKNTVASCMSGFRGEQTPLFMTAPTEKYIHKVDVALFMGWKVIYSNEKTTENQTNGSALILYCQSCPKEQLSDMVTAKVAIHGRHTHYTEASLISKLEDIGIGRPSTYASLVETIKERGYVKKMDIEGDKLEVVEYVLKNGNIIETNVEKCVGQEKGKLVIQPIGIMVAEFLTTHFRSLFEYEYTKKMEEELDEIANGVEKDTCKNCDKEIDRLLVPTKKIRFVLKDTNEYYVVFGKYGPVIQKEGSHTFLSVKKDIDFEKLQSGYYSLEDIMDKKEEKTIGEYKGVSVIVKKGPYGSYFIYNGENIGYKSVGLEERDSEDLVLEKFIKYMEINVGSQIVQKDDINQGVEKDIEKGEDNDDDDEETKTKKIIRELNGELSIRNGKYGAYIYYNRVGMKKPKFFALKGFSESYRFCQKEKLIEWIQQRYNVGIEK
jgi:DNA topoisomerase-1